MSGDERSRLRPVAGGAVSLPVDGSEAVRMPGFLGAGASAAGMAIASQDWSRHAVLGDGFAHWPALLRSTLATLLACPVASLLVWGDERAGFWNDAFVSRFGAPAGHAAGADASLVWPELWRAAGHAAAGSVGVAGRPGDRGEAGLVGIETRRVTVMDADGSKVGFVLEFEEPGGRDHLLLELADRLRGHSAANLLAETAACLLASRLGCRRVVHFECNRGGIGGFAVGEFHAPDLEKLGGATLRLDPPLAWPSEVLLSTDPASADGDPFASLLGDQLGGGSLVACPIVHRGRVLAMLVAIREAGRGWTDAEIELVRAFGQRTHDAIAAASLEATLRRAERMDMIGQFAGGLSHDLNNLLTGITGSLELLELRIGQGRIPDGLRFIPTAQEAAGRAASLSHQLLAFSRRQTLDPEPVSPNTLVLDLAEQVRRTVGSGIELTLRLEPACWTVRCDRIQLERAILNLCSNARDAMPGGGRLVVASANLTVDGEAATALELPEGSYAVVSVIDQGEGMDLATASRAFDPFFTTKKLGQGTGLGLSMVWGFARQSGGQVSLSSEPGAGTSVRVFLPKDPEADGGAAEAGADAQAGPGDAPRSVLVVDDEPILRNLMSEILAEQGFRVLEAGDAAGALDLLASDHPIDLLVTDLGLPGGADGAELAEAARALLPGLRVLFVTGYADRGGPRRWAVEGEEVMTKPFSLDALVLRVTAMLGAPSRVRYETA